jgi:hypothetical protein
VKEFIIYKLVKRRDHLGDLRNRLENNIQMDFKYIRYKGADWIQLAHGRMQ